MCLSQRYLSLFAYTHAKFERVEALLGQAHCLKTATEKFFSLQDLNDTGIGRAKKRENIDLKMEQCLKEQCLKEQLLYICLPVVVQLLHGITAVTAGGD